MQGEDSLDETRRVDSPSRFAADEFYRALAARPRRRVLAYLLEREKSTVEELADVLCGWEATDAMVPPERYERLRLALQHSHLPHLADAGLVSYDSEADSVAVSELDPAVEELVLRSIEAEQP